MHNRGRCQRKRSKIIALDDKDFKVKSLQPAFGNKQNVGVGAIDIKNQNERGQIERTIDRNVVKTGIKRMTVRM